MTGEIARLFVGLVVQGADKVKSELQGMKGGLGEARQAADALKGVLASLGIALSARAAVQMAEMGARSLELKDSFQELARQAGQSGDDILQALQRASGGAIAQNDLVLASNRAMMLGLKADSQSLADLLEVARFRARAMGLDTTQAFNDIVTGIGRASPLILDNLGLVFDSAKEYEAYALSIGKAADALTDAEKKLALQTAAVRVGKEQIEAAGGIARSSADDFRETAAAVADLKTALGELLAAMGVWSKAAELARGVTEGVSETAAWLASAAEYGQVIQKAQEAGRITKQQADALRATLKEQNSMYGDMAMSQAQFEARMNAALSKAGLFAEAMALNYKDYAASIDEYAAVVGALGWDLQRASMGVGEQNLQKLATGMLVKPQKESWLPDPATQGWLDLYWDTQRKEQDRFAEEGKRAAEQYEDAWESARDALEGTVQGLVRPTQGFDYRGLMDQMGMHIDTWDEDARRMMDVVNRGSESPWASFFEIPEDVKAGGEAEIKAWAAQQVQAYYQGQSTAGMSYNVDDIVAQYKDLAAQKELRDRLTKEAMAELGVQGIT
ncbi:MAG: hypothetical protein GX605_11795, partial [Chloroflexi bacterium]|nr:hypothetical protein [Chloroflexota bacterium]